MKSSETSGDFPRFWPGQAIPPGEFINRNARMRHCCFRLVETVLALSLVVPLGAPMMEDLIELVAASLARHGIECPSADPVSARSALPTQSLNLEPALAELPDHN